MKDKELENNEPEAPFFARFLEEQELPKVKTNIKAGMTLKYPSDRDEWE